MIAGAVLATLGLGVAAGRAAPTPFPGEAWGPPSAPGDGGLESGPAGADAWRAALWHGDGHSVVCDIAWRELNDQARAAVRGLLELDPDFSQFGPSCSWPDIVRGRPEYDAWTTGHYANLPRGADRFDVQRDCAGDLCVVEAIEIVSGRLRDRTLPAAVRLEALKFLGHFVGDIHQPLHVGYGDDLGANAVHACIPGRDSTNLHAVWDGFIVGRRMAETGLDWRGYGARLHGEIRPIERRRWSDLDPVTWAEESYTLVETEVYVGAGTGCFTNAYAAAHAFTVERRLKQAGYRLGALLNDLLG